MKQVEFFNEKDINLLAQIAGKPYQPDISQNKNHDTELKNGVWEKTGYWYQEVLSKIEGFDGRFESKRTTLGSAKGENGKRYYQLFKQYTWARIFRKGDEDKYIYFTVGVAAKDKSLVYKLDCQSEGNTILTQEQINCFNELVEDSPAKWIPINSRDLANYSWNTLIKETIQFINKYLGLYDEIIRKVWDIEGYSIPDIEIREYEDGKIREEMKKHKWRERNPNLVVDYKRHYKNIEKCPGCSMSPKRLYNINAIYLLELHHIVPLSVKNPRSKITFSDLTLLCPSCHRAIHKMMAEDGHKIISLIDFKKRLQ